jgi:hypothetical protein
VFAYFPAPVVARQTSFVSLSRHGPVAQISPHPCLLNLLPPHDVGVADQETWMWHVIAAGPEPPTLSLSCRLPAIQMATSAFLDCHLLTTSVSQASSVDDGCAQRTLRPAIPLRSQAGRPQQVGAVWAAGLQPERRVVPALLRGRSRSPDVSVGVRGLGESKRPVVESPWPQFTSECQRF